MTERGRNNGTGQNIFGNKALDNLSSGVTIYRPAVRMELLEIEDEIPINNKSKKDSNSSDKLVNTSDESMPGVDMIANDIDLNIIAGRNNGTRNIQSMDQGPVYRPSNNYQERKNNNDEPMAHSSIYMPPPPPMNYPRDRQEHERISDGERKVQQAEQAKARILEVPGKDVLNKDQFLSKLTGELMHSVMVDEEFSMVAAHVNDNTKRKIENGEYIDFVKLLPREYIDIETDCENEQLVMVN